MMYGERLKHRRKAKGLTQEKLGELVGCAGRTIVNHEKLGKRPSSSVVSLIEAVLGEF